MYGCSQLVKLVFSLWKSFTAFSNFLWQPGNLTQRLNSNSLLVIFFLWVGTKNCSVAMRKSFYHPCFSYWRNMRLFGIIALLFSRVQMDICMQRNVKEEIPEFRKKTPEVRKFFHIKLYSSKVSKFVDIIFWKWNRVLSLFPHTYSRNESSCSI